MAMVVEKNGFVTLTERQAYFRRCVTHLSRRSSLFEAIYAEQAAARRGSRRGSTHQETPVVKETVADIASAAPARRNSVVSRISECDSEALAMCRVSNTSSASTAASKKTASSKKPTMLLRNLPNHLKQQRLLNMWNDAGFQGKYDMFFMPTTKAGNNLGYAFLRFRSCEDAEQFKLHFDGMQLKAKKILEVTFAKNQNSRSFKMLKASQPHVLPPTFFDEAGNVSEKALQ